MRKKLDKIIREAFCVIKDTGKLVSKGLKTPEYVFPFFGQRVEDLVDYWQEYPHRKARLENDNVLELHEKVMEDKARFEHKAKQDYGRNLNGSPNYEGSQRVLRRLDRKYGVALYKLLTQIFYTNGIQPSEEKIAELSEIAQDRLKQLMFVHMQIDQGLNIEESTFKLIGYEWIGLILPQHAGIFTTTKHFEADRMRLNRNRYLSTLNVGASI